MRSRKPGYLSGVMRHVANVRSGGDSNEIFQDAMPRLRIGNNGGLVELCVGELAFRLSWDCEAMDRVSVDGCGFVLPKAGFVAFPHRDSGPVLDRNTTRQRRPGILGPKSWTSVDGFAFSRVWLDACWDWSWDRPKSDRIGWLREWLHRG